MNDVSEIGMVNRLATECQYEGFAPVRINVGGGVTQKFYGVGHSICLISIKKVRLITAIANSIINQNYKQ